MRECDELYFACWKVNEVSRIQEQKKGKKKEEKMRRNNRKGVREEGEGKVEGEGKGMKKSI